MRPDVEPDVIPGAAWRVAGLIVAALAAAIPAAGSVARADDDGPPTQRLAVEMTEYLFSPDTIELEAGVETHLTLMNRGQMMHEFEAPYLSDVQVNVETAELLVVTIGLAEVQVAAGQSVTLVFTPERKGEYTFVCDAKEPSPHQKLGMRGRLIVH
jgi:plastocyanin